MDKNILLSVLKENVGYHEKKSDKDLESKKANSGNKNYTKFAEFFDDLRKQKIYVFNYEKNPCEWCAIFAIYAFWVSYGEAAMKMLYLPYKSTAAGTKFFAQYFKDKKAFKKTPEVGDVIFFGTKGKESHVGIVTKVTEKMVYTIEGNKSNEVKECSYKQDNKNIAGYGRPNWNVKAEEKPKEEPKPTPAPAPKPAEVKYKVTAPHGLRLRKDPSTKSKANILTVMPKFDPKEGNYFIATKESNGWAYGKYGNYKGYACLKWLEKA